MEEKHYFTPTGKRFEGMYWSMTKQEAIDHGIYCESCDAIRKEWAGAHESVYICPGCVKGLTEQIESEGKSAELADAFIAFIMNSDDEFMKECIEGFDDMSDAEAAKRDYALHWVVHIMVYLELTLSDMLEHISHGSLPQLSDSPQK